MSKDPKEELAEFEKAILKHHGRTDEFSQEEREKFKERIDGMSPHEKKVMREVSHDVLQRHTTGSTKSVFELASDKIFGKQNKKESPASISPHFKFDILMYNSGTAIRSLEFAAQKFGGDFEVVVWGRDGKPVSLRGHDPKIAMELFDKIRKEITESRIILLDPDFLDGREGARTEDVQNANFYLNTPFENIWIENANPSASMVAIDSESDSDPTDVVSIHVMSVGIVEKGDGHELVVLYVAEDKKTGRKALRMEVFPSSFARKHPALGAITFSIANLLEGITSRSAQAGDVKINRIYKQKDGRDPLRVRRVIVISNRKNPSIRTVDSVAVNWKHCWEVMGHWRRHDGVGKNRQGDYVIPGRTWVNPHVRGDLDMPLIKKTRIFKDGETPNEEG